MANKLDGQEAEANSALLLHNYITKQKKEDESQGFSGIGEAQTIKFKLNQ